VPLGGISRCCLEDPDQSFLQGLGNPWLLEDGSDAPTSSFHDGRMRCRRDDRSVLCRERQHRNGLLRRWVDHRALLAECVREICASLECRDVDEAQGQSSDIDAVDLSEETHAFVFSVFDLSKEAIATQADVIKRGDSMIEWATSRTLRQQRRGNPWTHVSTIGKLHNKCPDAMHHAVDDQLCEDHRDLRQPT